MQDFKRDRPVMLEIAGVVHRGHATAPELSLDGVLAREGRPDLEHGFGHARSGELRMVV